MTPELFIETALNTGTTNTIEYNGESYQFGKIINPEELIKGLKKEK